MNFETKNNDFFKVNSTGNFEKKNLEKNTLWHESHKNWLIIKKVTVVQII